jgi:D-sedoheptulose 7-phosphate isomerase
MKSYIDEYAAAINRAMTRFDYAQFEKIIAILAEAYRNDRQVFIAGNGGSAATANHFVCDFGKNAVPFKGTGPGSRRFRIISVSDNIEKITALGNDISFEEIFRQQLINLMTMVVPLESYEQIEDIHLILMHMIVYYFKNHPEILEKHGS